LKIDYACYRKDASGIYAKILYFPKIEWCKILQRTENIPFFDRAVEFAESQTKDLLEACSRTGAFKFSNVTFASAAFLTHFPDGDYKTVFRVYDDVDLNVFNMTLTVIMVHKG
jgi:hypothetical protein